MAEETGKDEHEDEDVADESPADESSVGDGAPAEEKNKEYGGERSEVDAMGNDKRREVVGEQYGASVRKRLAVYGGVIGAVVLIVIAFLTLVKGYDNRDMPLKDTAPWTKESASQTPPRDVDFKANGPTDTIPADQIVNR